MVVIEGKYTGDLRCEALHGPSRSTLVTDAPLDNAGKGEAFSPTDLVATALGTCMLTLMGIAARRLGIDIAGSRADVIKEMVADPDRRIGRLPVTITVKGSVGEKERVILERAALTCPVHKSLDARVERPVTFVYEE
jgi:putative redox protein